jgi:hypothetical protein
VIQVGALETDDPFATIVWNALLMSLGIVPLQLDLRTEAPFAEQT